MKASAKGSYDTSIVGTVAFNAGDVNLRASLDNFTVANGHLDGSTLLTVEKPGCFSIDYDVPKMDATFRFMNTVRVMEKPLSLTYVHEHGENMTSLDGTIALNQENKVSANYMFGTGNCKLKYSYVHAGAMIFEPCYDISRNTWDLAMSQKVYEDNVLKATYQTSSKDLGLEWSRDSEINGFKISSLVNLADETKMPKLRVETIWNL
ncbi:outer envelope pore protein 24B, chloroplastic-like [Papaver somniferum]|uniref:outer envelope pore protein 24B, chloroplastic-like n=1 Tax=Papaver somniferum TaxID=3469 RepID=UPI000E6F91D8|nr:outer envelope pore protein 24B, chloroplastic-like [Papaver somniferum]